MQHIEITEGILRRYHSGQCSAEERAAVEAWLDEPEVDTVAVHGPVEEAEIDALLWEKIQKSTVRQTGARRNFKIRLLWPSIAASFLVLSICAVLAGRSGFFKAAPRLVQIDNLNGQFAKALNVDGLILTALPKGNIRAKINSGSGNVTFCDVMLIENRSVRDVVLDFASACSDGGKDQKNFICKKGITYVALKMNSISPDIIVVEQRYMEDYLPLNLAMQINKDLRSI